MFPLNLRTLPLFCLGIRGTSLLSFLLQDLPDLTVTDGVGERNGAFLFVDFPGDLNVLCTLFFVPYIKREDKR